MKHTGLKKYEYATVDNFTSDIGLYLRRHFNAPWRKRLRLFTKRKVIVEQYPKLEKRKSYIFVSSHYYDEDVISLLGTIDRNAYVLNGSIDQTEHNPEFLALWLNGMIYVNNAEAESRHSSLKKMKRVIDSGGSVLIFPEGSYNDTENLLIMKLFPGVYKLAKATGAEVVPMVSFCDNDSEQIYIRAGAPMNVTGWNSADRHMSARNGIGKNGRRRKFYNTPVTTLPFQKTSGTASAA